MPEGKIKEYDPHRGAASLLILTLTGSSLFMPMISA
jgi:hypothetical protein